MKTTFVDTLKSGFSKKHKGFSGVTHILTALCLFMLLFLFKIDSFSFYLKQIASNWQFLVVTFLVITGASLLPDLDNDVSTANARLGILGSIIHTGMATVAFVFFNLTRMKNDKDPESMHRLFWHAPVISVLLGAYFWLYIPKNSNKILDVFIKAYHSNNIGDFFINNIASVICLFLTFICLYLAIGVFSYWLFKFLPFQGGVKLGFTLALNILSIYFILSLSFSHLRFVGLSIALGYLFHLIGDLFSQGSIPIIWPIPNFIKKESYWRPWILGPFQVYTGGIINKILDFAFLGIDVFLVYLLFISGKF